MGENAKNPRWCGRLGGSAGVRLFPADRAALWKCSAAPIRQFMQPDYFGQPRLLTGRALASW